jgi:NDP-sugar pyrophosphorylase family protein
LLGDEFFVLHGDSYLPCAFAPIQSAYEAARRPALMTVLRNDDQWDKSNVLFKNGELILYDKQCPRPDMSHIDFGLYVLSSDVFLTCGESKVLDLADICQKLSKTGRLTAVEVSERFYEIGSSQGIRDTEEFLSRQLVVHA